jgi:hypothetical protein
VEKFDAAFAWDFFLAVFDYNFMNFEALNPWMSLFQIFFAVSS